LRFRTTANRIRGYISIRRETGIGENDGGNDNNNNNIYSNILFYIIIISTRRRQRWRWRDTTNNAWADNEHYYHGGHTPRATRSRNRVRSRTSAGAKGQCRPGRDYTVGNVRAVRPNRRRNTDEKLRSATPRRHRPGWDIKFRRPRPYHANQRSLVLLCECLPPRCGQHTPCMQSPFATTAADIFLTEKLTW